jgi:hypothetical protein
MIKRTRSRWMALALVLVGMLVLGCSAGNSPTGEATSPTGEGTGSTAYPVRDPGTPLAWNEKGTVTITNDAAYNIQVLGPEGNPLFSLEMKKGAVVEPRVDFTVETIEVDVPEELSSQYVAVGRLALQVHVVGDTGYGFSLRPQLTIHFADQEIQTAKQSGAALDVLKGNLIVLYKEQRSPKWVPQTSVSLDEASKTVTISNVAGAGAWRLVAKKGQ